MKTEIRRGALDDRFGLLALVIYIALSLLFFGRGLIGHLSDREVGTLTNSGIVPAVRDA